MLLKIDLHTAWTCLGFLKHLILWRLLLARAETLQQFSETNLCLERFVKLVSWYELLFSRGRTGTVMLLSTANLEARVLVNSVRSTCLPEPWLCRVWSLNVLMQMMCSVTQRPGRNTSTTDPFRSDRGNRAGPVQPCRWATRWDGEVSEVRLTWCGLTGGDEDDGGSRTDLLAVETKLISTPKPEKMSVSLPSICAELSSWTVCL